MFEELFLNHFFDLFCCFAIASTKPPHLPIRSVQEILLTVTPVQPRTRQCPGHGHLRRLGHPVVHHFRRNLHGRFARNKNDSSQFRFSISASSVVKAALRSLR